MPIKRAPCFSLETARMARPKSVFCTINNNTAYTTNAPAKDTSLGKAMKAGPISTVVKV
jgi:hypothetical protein